MAKKLDKKQMGGSKSTRLENRSEKVMGRAQKSWSKAQKALDYDDTQGRSGTSNAVGYANRMLNKAARQEEKAKRLASRSAELKAIGKAKGGSVKKSK